MQQLPGDADAAHGALRIFERDLLAEIGYGLHLPADLEADRRYRYHSEHGARPVAVAEAGAYRGLSLVELREGPLSSTGTRGHSRRLLRVSDAHPPGGPPLATTEPVGSSDATTHRH